MLHRHPCGRGESHTFARKLRKGEDCYQRKGVVALREKAIASTLPLKAIRGVDEAMMKKLIGDLGSGGVGRQEIRVKPFTSKEKKKAQRRYRDRHRGPTSRSFAKGSRESQRDSDPWRECGRNNVTHGSHLEGRKDEKKIARIAVEEKSRLRTERLTGLGGG